MERSILILTTLPHYCALSYADCSVYSFIIITSTTLSILWHSLGYVTGGDSNWDPNDIITQLDYGFALLWSLYEISRGFEYDIYPFIVLSNIVVFVWNIMAKTWIEHSVWHLVSAFKSVFVAYGIQELYWK
jgi:hypothetical protein